MPTDPYVYDVDYENEFGETAISADFSRDQAAQMVATLFRLDAWGDVKWARVTKTDRLRDMRSIEEIESNIIA